MAQLKDSGDRRSFGTGAVRDVAEGKGRCDLLPLGIVADLIGDKTLQCINLYILEGITDHLQYAIEHFCNKRVWDYFTMLLEVAKQYQDGCQKYGDRNWEKGIPVHVFIDSGVRHYLKFLRGDTDEPHDRAFIWNMLGAIWTHENKPELIDLPFAKKDKPDIFTTNAIDLMGEEDVSEPPEPQGKYEGLNNAELKALICSPTPCPQCPLSSYHNGFGKSCTTFILENYTKARKLMLDYLNGLEGKE